MTPTAIYLIKSDQVESVFKIGLSDAVPRRKVQIKNTYHLGGIVIAQSWFPTRKAAQTAEYRWHDYLSDYQYLNNNGREWFSLSDSLVNLFIDWAECSPNPLPIKALIKSGRYTPYQAEQLTNQLLNGIPLRSGGTIQRSD